jgi:type II secretion system protein J
MVEVMGVSLKTENEAWSVKTRQIRGSEGGRRGLPAFGGARGDQGFTSTSMQGLRWQFPCSPPPASPITQSRPLGQRLLRFSVLRETPMTVACDHFKKLKGYEGFTLLEVLVSMAILVIIMAALYSAYSTNVEAIQIARQNGEVHQTARIVLDRMTKDLQSALIQVRGSSEKIKLGLVGADRELYGRRADHIDFTTVTHLPLTEKGPASDLCEIGYLVDEDPEGQVLVLLRRDAFSVDEDFTKGGSLQEMARNVLEFKLTYQDAEGKDLDQWNTIEGKPTSGLPVLIKVRLMLKDELNREHVFSTTIHPELAERKKES